MDYLKDFIGGVVLEIRMNWKSLTVLCAVYFLVLLFVIFVLG